MGTFLFNNIIFGPVKSRRLGISLGVNLLPENRKICNFDCIYCECGLNANASGKNKLPVLNEVTEALSKKLVEMKQDNLLPDVITFAGNGEPTLHPEFSSIIDEVIKLRNLLAPNAKISVLSNATMLHRKEIVAALTKVDNNILKLDAGTSETLKILNQPLKNIPRSVLLNQLKQFGSNLIIQSLFTKGNVNGTNLDNTKPEELKEWFDNLVKLKPGMVMIYTIERDTPIEGLQKISKNELVLIAEQLEQKGIKTQVSA